jgi:uncharacterized protein (DUF1499 family)
MTFIILLALIGGAVYLALGPGSPERLEAVFPIPAFVPIHFETLRKNTKPNQYLVLPSNLSGEVSDAIAPTYAVNAAELKRAWEHLMARQPNIMQRGEATNDQLDYVQRTPRIRFPDLITVRFIALDENRSSLAIYSRSVFGHFDLGTNRKRITAWLKELNVK